MPLISDRLLAVKDRANEAKSSADLYLNPGSVGSGESVRFSFLGDKTLDFYEVWCDLKGQDKRKPLRFSDKPTDAELQDVLDDVGGELKIDKFGRMPYPKLSMAAFVWNYETSSVQILQMSQITIIETLASLLSDEDVANDPGAWDFELSKSGNLDTTRYTLVLKPGKRKGTVAKEVDAAWQECLEKGWNLEALLVGGDPTKPAGGLF